MNIKQRYELRKIINELAKIRGRHTELVSVYVPQGYDLNKIIQHLQQEQGTAENIKDKTTRTHVIDSLERMVRHLRLYKRTPENGLVVFSGNIAAQEGKTDIKIWSIEPPDPLNFRLYRCDQTFVLDHLRGMLEHMEAYGMIVLDNSEANIAYLKGTAIVEVEEMTSGVPSKMRAGGQCISPESLIQLSDGNIIKIKDSHNPNIVKNFLIEENRFKDSPIIDKFESKKNELYTFITKYPRLEIESSKDHMFFVFDNGIKEKAAEELKEGDYLLMPEKIEVNGNLQILSDKYYNFYKIKKSGIKYLIDKRKFLGFSQKKLQKKIGLHQAVISSIEKGKYNNFRPEKLKSLCEKFDIDYDWFLENHTNPENVIKLPKLLTSKLAQLVGYVIGDGNIESDRIGLSEASKDIAKYYKKEFSDLFSANSSIKFREKKNYYQVRIYGRPLSRFFKLEFPEIRKALNCEIPTKILKSDNKVIAGFLKGIFDAEGYVSDDALALGMNNKQFIKQLQLVLLRLGIISSYNEYDNRRNPYTKNHRFTIRIGDKTSLIRFKKLINFRSINKINLLNKLVKQRVFKGNKIRKIAISGEQIREIIEREGFLIKDFPKVTNFFRNERQMSKFVFKDSILKYLKNNKELYNKLKPFLDYKLIPIKIHKIAIKKGVFDFVDIEVKNHNFIANGILVHNSSVRFARLREIAIHEFYKRIGDKANVEFLPKKKELKGIIIGGPGPSKESFFRGAYLNNELKKIVLGVKDVSYTGTSGLHDLVERSQDLLIEEEVTKEKKIMQDFFTMLAKNSDKTAYGEKEVTEALNLGAVDTIMLSESLSDENMEKYEKLAQDSNCKIQIISTETREGIQLRDLGKVAAILRYAIK